jgi:sarcosine oxidase
MRRYDCIVVGLGAMGSATTYHLAKRGQKVLALEQFSQGHAFGSSHGDSRIIRQQYFEHPLYVPLVQRAYELWRELEQVTYRKLMTITGGLMIGPPDDLVVSGALHSAREHGLPHQVLSADQIRERFPAFNPPPGHVAAWDPRAGFLIADACNEAHIDAARAKGADIRYGEPMRNWTANDDDVRVTTSAGTYSAGKLVLTTGSWTKAAAAETELPLTIEREVLVWFDPSDEADLYDSSRFPIFCHEYEPGHITFGVSRTARGVKAGIHHSRDFIDSPDAVERIVTEREIDQLRELLRGVLPDLASSRIADTGVCLYTNTPDDNFIIDWHPFHDRVLVCSPCSGHGFKFASVIGEVQADLLTTGKSSFDLAPFRIDRFAAR